MCLSKARTGRGFTGNKYTNETFSDWLRDTDMTERLWNLLFNGFLGLFISLVLLCAVVECGRKMNIGITGWLIGFFALIFVVFYTVGLVAVFIEGGKQSPEDDSGKTRQESLRYFAPSIDWAKSSIHILKVQPC